MGISIRLKASTYRKLIRIKKRGESVDVILEKLMDSYFKSQKEILLKYFGKLKGLNREGFVKRIKKVRNVEILP